MSLEKQKNTRNKKKSWKTTTTKSQKTRKKSDRRVKKRIKSILEMKKKSWKTGCVPQSWPQHSILVTHRLCCFALNVVIGVDSNKNQQFMLVKYLILPQCFGSVMFVDKVSNKNKIDWHFRKLNGSRLWHGHIVAFHLYFPGFHEQMRLMSTLFVVLCCCSSQEIRTKNTLYFF